MVLCVAMNRRVSPANTQGKPSRQGLSARHKRITLDGRPTQPHSLLHGRPEFGYPRRRQHTRHFVCVCVYMGERKRNTNARKLQARGCCLKDDTCRPFTCFFFPTSQNTLRHIERYGLSYGRQEHAKVIWPILFCSFLLDSMHVM